MSLSLLVVLPNIFMVATLLIGMSIYVYTGNNPFYDLEGTRWFLLCVLVILTAPGWVAAAIINE